MFPKKKLQAVGGPESQGGKCKNSEAADKKTLPRRRALGIQQPQFVNAWWLLQRLQESTRYTVDTQFARVAKNQRELRGMPNKSSDVLPPSGRHQTVGKTKKKNPLGLGLRSFISGQSELRRPVWLRMSCQNQDDIEREKKRQRKVRSTDEVRTWIKPVPDTDKYYSSGVTVRRSAAVVAYRQPQARPSSRLRFHLIFFQGEILAKTEPVKFAAGGRQVRNRMRSRRPRRSCNVPLLHQSIKSISGTRGGEGSGADAYNRKDIGESAEKGAHRN